MTNFTEEFLKVAQYCKLLRPKIREQAIYRYVCYIAKISHFTTRDALYILKGYLLRGEKVYIKQYYRL